MASEKEPWPLIAEGPMLSDPTQCPQELLIRATQLVPEIEDRLASLEVKK
jgi:hypothetical protein